ncbi:ATP-binding cassette domain-containing protein [Prevotella sp.]|uniref:ATP-binding cassette domain-containing protein n=1 Tax=Prevotella sp. TaxID=59823 RepID=UPI003DA62309
MITLFFITILQGFTQGISIVLLIPLLGMLDPSAGKENSWTNFLRKFLETFGVNLNITVVIIFFILCLLFVALLNYSQTVLQTTYQQGFSYEMRKKLFKKIIMSDWTFLNGKSKHNHIQILTTEIPKMTTYYYYYLGLSSKVLFIVAHIIVALSISVQFTLYITFIGVTLLFILRRYLLNAKKYGSINVLAYRNMLKRIDDFWTTVKLAKVHNSESFFYQKFAESNTQMLHYQNKQSKNSATPVFIFTCSGIIALVLIIYIAYEHVHLPFQSLFILILLFARIFPQFIGINGDVNMVYSLSSSAKLVLDLDGEMEEKEFSSKNTPLFIDFKQKIELSHISFGYHKGHNLFSDFNVSIKANQITGIVGRSGCGKTTFIDILSGLQRPLSGELLIDGQKITEDIMPAWRSIIGYLPQDSFFLDGTIRDNLIMDSKKNISDQFIWDTLKSVNAYDLVKSEKKGLDTEIINYQYHFSGGERQRLALARTLLRCPKLLLLDEATSALDTNNELIIMDCLSRLKYDVTIVFVTHHQGLSSYFDQIINL